MVEFGLAALFEEFLYVCFNGRGRQIARVACDAALGTRVGLEELVDGEVDAGSLGRGDDD